MQLRLIDSGDKSMLTLKMKSQSNVSSLSGLKGQNLSPTIISSDSPMLQQRFSWRAVSTIAVRRKLQYDQA